NYIFIGTLLPSNQYLPLLSLFSSGSFMKKVFLCFVLMGCMLHLSAQSYTTALGVRLGNSWGITAVQKFLPRITGELLLQNDWRNNSYIHLLGRKHHGLITKRLNFFYGGGVHLGLNSEAGQGLAGIDGVLGLELSFARLNFAYDFKPHLNLGRNVGFVPNTAFSIRYILVKNRPMQKWKKKQQKKRKQRQKDRKKGQSPAWQFWKIP
ncbi:MAG: hypothetical protein AAFV07_17720, partial [Bacteroidota bacterium]